MPPLDAGAHLVDHLFSIGPAMGEGPVTFQEIAAWQALTGHVLQGWEADALRRLSAAWLAEYQAADDPARPPPYTPAERVKPAEEVASKLEAMFDRMAAQDRRSGISPKTPRQGRQPR